MYYKYKKNVKKLTKAQLIKLLLKKETIVKPKIEIIDDKPTTSVLYRKNRKPIPTPHKFSVNDMVKQYEQNIILPPSENNSCSKD